MRLRGIARLERDWGVPYQSIYKYAAGTLPRRETLEKIAATEGALADDLLAGRVDAAGKYREQRAAFLASLPREPTPGSPFYSADNIAATIPGTPGIVLLFGGTAPDKEPKYSYDGEKDR